MNITVERAELNRAISVAARFVKPASSMKVLETLKFEAQEPDKLVITGYNLETGVSIAVATVTVREAGVCCIPTRMIADIIKKVPNGLVSISTDENYKVSVRAGKSRFSLMALSADDFPAMPAVDDGTTFTMPSRQMKRLIEGTFFSASTDIKGASIITGVHCEVQANDVTMVALDGFRLAKRTWHAKDANYTPMEFTVPASSLWEVTKLLDSGENVTVSVGTKHLVFSFSEDTKMISRRLEGTFVMWRKFIPETTKYKLVADTKEFSEAIDRISLVINEKYKSPVRAKFGNGQVELSATTTIASANDECDLNGSALDESGNPTTVGFSVNFMKDAIDAITTDSVDILIDGGLRPIILVGNDEDIDFTYLIQPVRLS